MRIVMECTIYEHFYVLDLLYYLINTPGNPVVIISTSPMRTVIINNG